MSKVASKLTVHETIHHGDYYHERDITIAPTWFGFVNMLNTSPYCYGYEAEDNRYTAMSFANLLTTGKCEVGWSRFVVTNKVV